jgi:VanZ family protein
LLHAGAYFVMALLGVRALAKGLRERAPTAALCGGIMIAIAYGATDEWHQSHVAERVGSWLDLLYDGVGALMAGAALTAVWNLRGDPR